MSRIGTTYITLLAYAENPVTPDDLVGSEVFHISGLHFMPEVLHQASRHILEITSVNQIFHDKDL